MTEPVHNPAAHTGAGPELVRCPLLWVEDDPVLSDWVAQSLQDDGWPVLVAHDRLEALQKQEHEVPKGIACLAILDMGLPPSPSRPDEGLRLLAELVGQWPLLHAIVLTGQSEASADGIAKRSAPVSAKMERYFVSFMGKPPFFPSL